MRVSSQPSVGLAMLTLASVMCWASETAAQAPPLKQLTIEQLLELNVTTAQRRAEPIRQTPAATSVITADDLRRSGVTTIADALQLVDGVFFARLNNGSWRIGARGLASAAPNKLLVMIDGRMLYSSLYTVVFWNSVSYALEDIDRIEVVRGPGATLWGANAVNGIINIITKHTRETQGTYAQVTTGNEDRATLVIRHGAQMGATTWRAYGQFADRDNSVTPSGTQGVDGRRRGQVGVRVDGGSPQGANWMLVADVFHSREGFAKREDGSHTEVAIQGRWSQPLPAGSRLNLQSFYRREHRRNPVQLTYHVDSVDVDATHAFSTTRHSVVWGGSLRVNSDETYDYGVLSFDPAQRTYPLSAAFVQDEYALVPNTLFVTLGTKYEHNAFSGGDLQPNVRARWHLGPSQMLWGAVSHAVRRPTRYDEDSTDSATAPPRLGNRAFQPESVVATELGYRTQPKPYFSLDLTAFRHVFDDLRSTEVDASTRQFGNSLEGRTHGVELAANLQPIAWWRTRASYTWMDTAIDHETGSLDLSTGSAEANDPHHLYTIRTSIDLPHRFELDALLRGVGELPDPAFDGYSELNLRLGWMASPRLEYWASGQDLLHRRHAELPSNLNPVTIANLFERSFRVGVSVRY